MSDTRGSVPGSLLEPSEASTPAGPGHAISATEISFVELVNILLRSRRLVFGAPIVVAIVAAGIAFLQPRTYSATASFMSQSAEMSEGGGGSVLSQLGLRGALLGGSPAELYAELVKTQEIQFAAAETEYHFKWQGEEYRGNLMDFLKVGEGDPIQRRQKALKKLEKVITVETRGSGVVKVKVTTDYAPLSEQVAARVLDLVADFNLKRRQSQAGMERRFAGERVGEAQQELRQAEAELARFLDRNREFRQSPVLMIEYGRLQQEATQRRQIYHTLLELYERARIEEVRNTPVITVVDNPTGFAQPNARGTVRFGVLGLLVGGVIGVFGALSREFLRTVKESQRADIRELVELSGRLGRGGRRIEAGS